MSGNNMQIGTPEAFVAHSDTAQYNGFVKLCGAKLVAVARENTQLHEQLYQERQKASSYMKKEQMLDVVLEAVERRIIRPAQAREKLSEWSGSGRGVNYYRDMLGLSQNLSPAEAVGNAAKESSAGGLDSAGRGRDNGSTPSVSRRSYDEKLDKALANI